MFPLDLDIFCPSASRIMSLTIPFLNEEPSPSIVLIAINE